MILKRTLRIDINVSKPGPLALSCKRNSTKLERTSLSTGGCKCPSLENILPQSDVSGFKVGILVSGKLSVGSRIIV